MSKQILLKKSVVAVALTLATSQVVMAQDAADTSARPIERVFVTGSNIKRIDAESATPLQIVKREEIARLGVNSVRQLLDTLTASTGGLSDIGGSNSFAGGASSASLRNLGKQSTLVLLNSRRVAPYALADYNEVFTNLDSLPLEAVERVEVLRSGGSAIYGSDAVAGVINIITRNDYQGLNLSASREQSQQHSQFHETKASITGGFGNLDTDRYNVLANVELYQRGHGMWRDVLDDINPIYGEKFATLKPGSGLMFGNRGTPSTFSYPGNLLGQGALPGCTTKNAAGLCVYDRFSRFEVQPEAKRANMLVSGRYKFSDTTEGFAEALVSRTKTTYRSAYATYDSTAGLTTWGNPATGQATSFDHGPLPSTHPLNLSGEDLNLRYRFLDDPGFRQSESTEYRVLAGLKGTYNNYDWESAVGVAGGKVVDRSRGGFFSVKGFTKYIGTPGYDEAGNIRDPQFFNRGYTIGGQNSPEVLGAIFPESGYDGKITQYFWDAKASGEVAKFGGRPVMMAVGADLRHEKFVIRPSDNLLAGDIVRNGASSADASRNSAAAYTEVEVPLTSALNLTAAARVDKFAGFDAHVSPKLALRWEASKQLLFRGTLETGFRAPNLTESANSSKFSFSSGTQDPKRCPAAQAYANDLRTQSDALPDTDPLKAIKSAKADAVEGDECFGGVPGIVVNNPDLKPETSRSATVGFVFEPVRGYSLSVDYWNIKRKDEIGTKSNDELLASEASQPAGTIVRLDPKTQESTFTSVDGRTTQQIQDQYGVTAGPIASIKGMFLNVAKTKTSGFDVSGAARIDTGIGRVDLSLNATRLLEYRSFYSERDGGSYGDNLAGQYGYSKTKVNLNTALQTGNFNNSLRFVWNSPTQLKLEYYDDQYDAAACADRGWSNGECRIASYIRTDYNLSYTGIKNVTLAAHVTTLFNRRPPLDLRALDSDGGGVIPQSRADVMGRVFRVSLEYKF